MGCCTELQHQYFFNTSYHNGKLVSGFLGEKLPEQAVTILIDVMRDAFINDAKKLSNAYTNLFVGIGVFTTVASSLSLFRFFYNSKERVMKSVKSPSVIQFHHNLSQWLLHIVVCTGVLADFLKCQLFTVYS